MQTVKKMGEMYARALERFDAAETKRHADRKAGEHRFGDPDPDKEVAQLEENFAYEAITWLRADSVVEAGMHAAFILSRLDCIESSVMDEDQLRQEVAAMQRMAWSILAFAKREDSNALGSVMRATAAPWRDPFLTLPERRTEWETQSGYATLPDWLMTDTASLADRVRAELRHAKAGGAS